MKKSIDLFHLKNDEIKIDIVARFEGDDLIIDGYDIGPRVKEALGDSDYEYMMTIEPESVARMYELLDVKPGDRKGLLKALAGRFDGNKCFSEIGNFLDENNVQYKRFTWT